MISLKFLLFVGLIFTTSAQPRLPNFIENILERGREVVNQHFIRLIEGQRENFAVGWPILGIPPLDPFYIERVETTIDTISTLTSIDFILTDADLRGLQDFEINRLDVRIARLTVNFDISFKQLLLDGTHSTRALLVVLPVSGTGPMSMVLNDVRVNGTIQMNTLQDRYLNLETLKLNISVGSANARLTGFGFILDGTISALLSAALPGLIDDSQERINEVIQESVVDPANAFLNQFRFIDLVFEIIRNVIRP